MNDETPIGNNDWLEEFGLKLEDRVSCDSDQCKNDAIFYSRTTCCKSVMLACTPCMVSAGKSLQVLIKKKTGVKCTNCNKIVPAIGWLSMPSRITLDKPAET